MQALCPLCLTDDRGLVLAGCTGLSPPCSNNGPSIESFQLILTNMQTKEEHTRKKFHLTTCGVGDGRLLSVIIEMISDTQNICFNTGVCILSFPFGAFFRFMPVVESLWNQMRDDSASEQQFFMTQLYRSVALSTISNECTVYLQR